MLSQIAAIISGLAESIKILKELIVMVNKMIVEKELRNIDSAASAHKKARKLILESIEKADDNETRLLLADAMYKLSVNPVGKA